MKATFLAALVAAFTLTASPVFAQALDREIPVGRATTVRLNVSGNVHVRVAPSGDSVGIRVVDYGPKVPAMRLTTSRTGSRLSLSVTGPSRNILPFVGASGYTLDVAIPKNVKLDLRQFAGDVHVDRVTAPTQIYDANGSITVEDAESALTAESDFGDIEVKTASEVLELTCGTGSVRATLAPAWRGSMIRMEATKGNLTLNVPRGFRARYDITSGSGIVRNPLRPVPHAPLVFMLTETGSATVAPAAG